MSYSLVPSSPWSNNLLCTEYFSFSFFVVDDSLILGDISGFFAAHNPELDIKR
jgi:hypothetical protein